MEKEKIGVTNIVSSKCTYSKDKVNINQNFNPEFLHNHGAKSLATMLIK